jgi:hypothetical protein
VGASGGTGVNRPGGPAVDDNMSSRTVTRVQVDPRYQRRLGGDEFDSAILTVSASMINPPNSTALPLATAAELQTAFSDDTSQHLISGWGDTTEGGSPSELLLFATVPLVSDSTCAAEYDPAFEFAASAMVCAGDPPKDTCQGDSGGPLAIDMDTGGGQDLRLGGITSFGHGCGTVAGVYTEVSETSTRSFLTNFTTTDPPTDVGSQILGTLRVGESVTCVQAPSAGTGTQVFWYVENGPFFDLFATGPTVVLPALTLGKLVACDVRIENDGGFAYATMPGGVGPVAARPAAAPGPKPTVTVDTTAPTAGFRRTKCGRKRRGRRRCQITLRAVDQGGTIKRPTARLTFKRRTCRRVDSRRRCRRRTVRRTIRLRPQLGGLYTAAVSLKRGSYKLTVVVTDAAGNRSKTAKLSLRVR